MNTVKNTGVPESSVLGTTDRHEEKSIDSVIQYICMLEGTVQVNVPESSETRDDYSTDHAACRQEAC